MKSRGDERTKERRGWENLGEVRREEKGGRKRKTEGCEERRN